MRDEQIIKCFVTSKDNFSLHCLTDTNIIKPLFCNIDLVSTKALSGKMSFCTDRRNESW